MESSDEGSPLQKIPEQRPCPFTRGEVCGPVCLKSILSLERKLGRRLQSRSQNNKELSEAQQSLIKLHDNQSVVQRVTNTILGRGSFSETRQEIRLHMALEMKDALDVLQTVCECNPSTLPCIDTM